MKSTFIALAIPVICALVPAAFAQECLLPRNHHPWGRFHSGSWKQVRVVTETLGPDGNVMQRGITETTTTLTSVDDQGYGLRVDVTVDVGGKRFASPSQLVWQGYFGQKEGQTVQVRKTGESHVILDGRRVTCEQRAITIADDSHRRTATICYSPQISPYTLRRETVSAAGEPSQVRLVAECIGADRITDVMGVDRLTSRVKTVTTVGKNTIVTVETVCDDVPGGVIAHTSQETDEAGKIIRRSSLELLAYESVERPQGNELPRRRKYSRRERRGRD